MAYAPEGQESVFLFEKRKQKDHVAPDSAWEGSDTLYPTGFAG
jgi:hypothetical protein